MIIKVISFHPVVVLVLFFSVYFQIAFEHDMLGVITKIKLVWFWIICYDFFFLTGNMNENPWQVDSVQAFAFLNCPECTFKTREETFFQVNNFVTFFLFCLYLSLAYLWTVWPEPIWIKVKCWWQILLQRQSTLHTLEVRICINWNPFFPTLLNKNFKNCFSFRGTFMK